MANCLETLTGQVDTGILTHVNGVIHVTLVVLNHLHTLETVTGEYRYIIIKFQYNNLCCKSIIILLRFNICILLIGRFKGSYLD